MAHYLTQINSHKKVGGCQITHQKFRHIHFASGKNKNKYNRSVSEQSAKKHYPDTAS